VSRDSGRGAELADPAAGGKHALRSLARRHAVLDEEFKELHQARTELIQQAAQTCWHDQA